MPIDPRHQQMVDSIARRGVQHPAVLAAMQEVPRDQFVPAEHADVAFDDTPIPIGGGQTISQPLIVAWMAAEIAPTAGGRVLDVGTGSGYSAAVLSRIVAEVVTIERNEELARQARDRFTLLEYDNIHVEVGDGTLGWPDGAPYNGIVVAAAAPGVPSPLPEQLADGGHLVLPVADQTGEQQMTRITRAGDSFTEMTLGPVRFVPLIGELGWPDTASE